MISAQRARIAALVLALAVTVLLLVQPLSPTSAPREPLLSHGWRAWVFLIPPVVLTIVPLLVAAGRPRRVATGVCAALLVACAVLTLFVTGLLYFPTAAALVVAAFLRDPQVPKPA